MQALYKFSLQYSVKKFSDPKINIVVSFHNKILLGSFVLLHVLTVTNTILYIEQILLQMIFLLQVQ